MGQVTRTNFGCVVTVVLNNSEVIHLPTTEQILLAGIPGKCIVPLAVAFKASVIVDYTNIDANAFLNIETAVSHFSLISSFREATDNAITALLQTTATWTELSSFAISPVQTIGHNNSGSGVSPIGPAPIGEGVRLKMNNQAAGILTGGDAANTLTVTTFYCVV